MLVPDFRAKVEAFLHQLLHFQMRSVELCFVAHLEEAAELSLRGTFVLREEFKFGAVELSLLDLFKQCFGSLLHKHGAIALS